MGPLGAACAGCWGVPAPLCWREGGPVLLCIVLLSLLFFLSVAWRVRHPRGRPAEGLGVNKADGRGLWRSLHGLASLLSSVGHLCGQASQGHCGQGQAPRVPLTSLCSDLSPAALSVGCYLFYLKGETLFPQAHAPVWVALSGVIPPPRTPWGFPQCRQSLSGAMQNPLGEKGGGSPTLLGASPMALTVSKSFHNVTFFPFFNALLTTR